MKLYVPLWQTYFMTDLGNTNNLNNPHNSMLQLCKLAVSQLRRLDLEARVQSQGGACGQSSIGIGLSRLNSAFLCQS